MPKPAKVLHHVRRLVASLAITKTSESDIDLLIKTLSETYREYTLEPAGQLRAAVSEALSSVIATMNTPSSKVMSLNQIVSSQYRNVPSKRQRPADPEDIDSDGGGNTIDDFYQVTAAGQRTLHTPQCDSGAESDRNQSKERETSAAKEVEKAASSSSSPTPSGKKKSRGKGSSIKGDQSNSSSSGRGDDVESDIVNAIMSKNRSVSSEFLIPRPNTRLCDMAGIDSITSQVKELVFYPVLYPGLYNYLGVQPPCGLLLHGPSGCGKTALAYAIAGELGLPFFKASGPELIGGTSGESEERIRDIFLAAAAKAPSVLFIDALDVIAGKKDSAQRGMDRRIVAQLFDSIDSIISMGEENLKIDDNSKDGFLSRPTGRNGGEKSNGAGSDILFTESQGGQGAENGAQTKRGLVVLMAATNKADALDAGVRGRFSRELSLPVPDAPSRTKILALMTKRMKVAEDVDLTELGRVTPGFVGADLKALAREAGMLAVSRIVDLHPEILTDKNIEDKNGNKNKNGDLKISNFENVTMKAEASREESRGTAGTVGPAGPAEIIVIKNAIQREEISECDSSMMTCEETSREFLQNSESVNGISCSDAMNLPGEVTYSLDYANATIIKTESKVEKIDCKLENSHLIVEGNGNEAKAPKNEEISEGRMKGKDRGINEETRGETSGETSTDAGLNENRSFIPLSLPSLCDVAVEMSDFLTAAKSVQPTAKREGFAVVPDVTWGDVGALSEVREELLHNVLEPIAHPERFRSLGLEVPAGVLFFGPPGCGKTLLAKALANQSGANFISVKGPELLNMYVGESESRVRQVFSRARASAPCVIFFDELDALCPRRASGAEGGSGVSERVVNQLLTELDGLETRKDVYIIAATNRLELIDEAMLRPGRLGKLLYVPLPDAPDRIAILTALTRKVSIDKAGVDITAIGGDPRTEGFSGADLAALVREAGLAVVREMMSRGREYEAVRNITGDKAPVVGGLDGTASSSTGSSSSSNNGTNGSSSSGSCTSSSNSSFSGNNGSSSDVNQADRPDSTAFISGRHFEAALRRVRPSVALHDRQRYDRVHENIKGGMGAIQALAAAAAHKPNTRIGLPQ